MIDLKLTDVAPSPFTLVGDPNAAACEGDFCEISVASGPAAEQSIVNQRLDENDV